LALLCHSLFAGYYQSGLVHLSAGTQRFSLSRRHRRSRIVVGSHEFCKLALSGHDITNEVDTIPFSEGFLLFLRGWGGGGGVICFCNRKFKKQKNHKDRKDRKDRENSNSEK
jgi:hypothetical protein